MAEASQVEIIRLTVDDWSAYRDLRLQALADAPEMFGSTLEREQAFSEEDFRERLRQRAQWAASIDGEFVGTIGVVLDRADQKPLLVSMWVHPDARRRGVGELLVRTVLDFERERGSDQVRLWVTEGNDGAERLYARNGFLRTGKVQRVRPEEPDHTEVEMVCDLTKS